VPAAAGIWSGRDGALGALIALLFVFGTLPAVAMPLIVAMASILNTYPDPAATYITDVSDRKVPGGAGRPRRRHRLLALFIFATRSGRRPVIEHALVETMTRRQVGGDIGLDGRLGLQAW
jgi:hypothetical protein